MISISPPTLLASSLQLDRLLIPVQNEVQYGNAICYISVNGTSGLAGEITSSCQMQPGQVTIYLAANLGAGGAVPGAVTDISLDTGDGAINLQLFGTRLLRRDLDLVTRP